MLDAGVIEPVDCSDWATPLVIASKADGGIRICADFKVTLNQVLSVDKYPLPRIDDLLSNLSGSTCYSKLDLSQAYNQIGLDDSKRYTVINTHRGLFMYNRLVYGLSSSPGIFQRIMSNLLREIPNVIVFMDDILLYGKTMDDHLQALHRVLQKLQENGLKIKLSKCTFFAKEVKYLGYVIDKNGIRVDEDKIKPILNMTEPRTVSELRSFLGMVNFYGKFIRNLSTHVAPLNDLLKKNNKWSWGNKEKRAFETVKQMLLSCDVLAHYDSARPLVVTCDASAHGLGAVLTQPDAAGAERPVAYASRALTQPERNYSQIHKEALAIIYAVKKFHQYLFGREFLLRTDHKPLLSIFNPEAAIPSMTTSRMQRWALTLSAYNFKIEYISTDKNIADALSRMIAGYRADRVDDHVDVPEQTYLHFATEALLLDSNVIKQETNRDPLLGRVLSYIKQGWPREVEIRELKPYFNRKSELYIELGCIMWGPRVVIPNTCRERVLKELHDSHMGMVKTKSLARSYVWWPGLDEAIQQTCAACEVCAEVASMPPRHAPRAWPWPDRPWTRLHVDFLGPIAGATYMVLVDSCSKWIEIVRMNGTNASNVINKLREIWARFGIPKQLVSDNGPPFSSIEFESFLRNNGIEHIFSSPYHPSSNGAAESAVKICKQIIKKAIVEKKDINVALCRFLLMYRNTEHSATGESPAQLLLGRSVRTRLDRVLPDRAAAAHARQERQLQARLLPQGARALAQGDPVWYRTYGSAQKWAKGKVIGPLGETDYEVESSDGGRIHRHIDQIRKRLESSSKNCKQNHQCNLENPLVYYPSILTSDDNPIVCSEGASSGSAAEVTAGPAELPATPQRGTPPPAVAPAEPPPADPEPGPSTGLRRYPRRDRKPATRYGLEID
ncbi:uncharacterized protein K02A2.6-like [Plutella xylostella]|uniref:uncharacterized protein K02A2.6-like n=1 Tax=Plutella xylostella TaxID=51655 RepID=UPI0020324147|nr:uncharacterized protein K02A2.6-like [Plutella xylostella]